MCLCVKHIYHTHIHTCCAMSGVSDPSISPQNTQVLKGMFTPNANESSVYMIYDIKVYNELQFIYNK